MPIFLNFLAAFRAHSNPLPKASASISTSAAMSSTAALWSSAQHKASQSASQPSEPGPSSPKPVPAKSQSYSTAAAAQERPLHPSLVPLQHAVSPQTHLPKSAPSPAATMSYPTCQEVGRPRARRGSASSADSAGFRETRAPSGEKWFVGGVTTTGEERYYKLSMVRRDRSADRISADQLSL